MFFELKYKDKESLARFGIIRTKKGDIETPNFMPVGTSGAVKALIPRDLINSGIQILLCNTYHLFLRPGIEVIKKFGSLHNFISWDKPILTDSGGFQIFSIKGNSKVTERGVEFKSHINGSKFFLTPEDVVDIQNIFDSDIQMVLDNFAPHPASKQEDRRAMEITYEWAKRARKRFLQINKSNFQFVIVQGGLQIDLREESLEQLLSLDSNGYAIGGLSVGEKKEDFEKIIAFLLPKMPVDKPRYLMGSGTPDEILFGVENGVDLFDCVLPTRNARNGTFFSSYGKLVIKNSKYKFDKEPIDRDCRCYTCKKFSRAYLRHLYISREINSSILNTIHNVHFYLDFISKMRYAIKSDSFKEFKKNFLINYRKGV